MNRFEIMILVELFNIRKCKKYPKYIIKDIYSSIDNIFRYRLTWDVSSAYSDFISELKEQYITRTPLEYRYVLELIDYLDNFKPHSYVRYATW